MQFNRHFINRIEKKDVLRLLLALVAVFVIGVLGEFVCNFPALRANGWTRQATRTIALDEVQVSGFERLETEKTRGAAAFGCKRLSSHSTGRQLCQPVSLPL